MSTKQEIGGYRDAHLEAEELVRRAGPVLESFVQERILLDGPRFKQVGPDLRDLLTGITIEEFYDPVEMRKKWPHGFADWMPDTEEQISWATIENACLRPSPKHVAELFKLVGEKRAREIMAQWGADPVK